MKTKVNTNKEPLCGNKKKYLFSILCICCIKLMLSSCGIPSITLFKAASINTDPGAKTITITHNSDNDTIQSAKFFGYQVYYKLYASNDTDTRANDKDYISDSSARVPSPSVLTAKNFLKIKTVNFVDSENKFKDITTSPTIAISADNEKIILDFGVSDSSEHDYIHGEGNSSGYQALLINEDNIIQILHRNLNASSKSFFNTITINSFDADDYDVKKMLSSFNNRDDLELVIAVIPYGTNLADVQVIYGTIAVSEDIKLDYTRTP